MFEWYYNETINTDVSCYLILDGDEAGKKALRALRNRSNRSSFKDNIDFFILPRDIELLFSPEFLKKTIGSSSKIKLVKDIEENIIDINIPSNKKVKFAQKIIKNAKIEDYKQIQKLFNRIKKVIDKRS